MESTTLRDDRPEPDASVRIPNRPDSVTRVRRTVAERARLASVPPDRLDDLVVAVSEAVTNAIEAQQRAGVDTPVEVTCQHTGTLFEVCVHDHGDGFNPGDLPLRPPLSDPQHLALERGWGIQLMRELTDEVIFDLTGDGTAVVLRVALTS